MFSNSSYCSCTTFFLTSVLQNMTCSTYSNLCKQTNYIFPSLPTCTQLENGASKYDIYTILLVALLTIEYAFLSKLIVISFQVVQVSTFLLLLQPLQPFVMSVMNTNNSNGNLHYMYNYYLKITVFWDVTM